VQCNLIIVMVDKKAKTPHAPRNRMLPSGVMRFSHARMYQAKAIYKKKGLPATKADRQKAVVTKTKPIGGEKNGKERVVKLQRMPRAYDSEKTKKAPKPLNKKPFSQHKRHLRPSLTPGTVVILLAGRHKGKRAVFLKQLASGLLLVSGPMHLNNIPLRRINQIYVIATKTKLDVSGVNIPDNVSDEYFRRSKRERRRKVKADDDIFAEKKEGYVVSDQRKQDQTAVDTQLLNLIRAHPDKKLLFGYLGSTFSLRKNEYPHRMLF